MSYQQGPQGPYGHYGYGPPSGPAYHHGHHFGGAPQAPQDHPSVSTSLTLGILGAVLFGALTGVPAILVGRKALAQIIAEPHRWRGAPTAKLAIGLGWLTILETTGAIAIIAACSSWATAIAVVSLSVVAFAIFSVSLLGKLPASVARMQPLVQRARLGLGLGIAGIFIGGIGGMTVLHGASVAAEQRCVNARAMYDGAARNENHAAAHAGVTAMELECHIPSAEAAKLRAEIDAKQAAAEAKRKQEEEARKAKEAADREAAAVAAFPNASANIAARIKAATSKSWQAKWEESEQELDAAQRELDHFKGSSVEQSKEHAQLTAQVAERRKGIQPQLDQIKAKRAAAAAVAELTASLRGPKPTNSAWDGSVHAVERYIKQRMHDPDSYQHVGTSEAEAEGDHWVVTSTYRGKNMFGALIIKTSRFHIQRGEVVRAADVDD